ALWVGGQQAVSPRILILRGHWETLLEEAGQALQRFHEHWPDEPGVDQARLRRMNMPTLPEPVWRAVCEYQIQTRLWGLNGPWLHAADHAVTLGADEAELAARLLPRIQASGYEPLWV